jgi:hypothetical protein
MYSQMSSLEGELAGWKFTRDLTKDIILQLTSSIESMNPGIESAKMPFSSHYCIPKEIWIIIFEHCLVMELEEYLITANATLFLPTPVILSLVCSQWHKIISKEHKLWSYIAIYPCKQLTDHKSGLLNHAVSMAGSEFTFISNLSYKMNWDTGNDDPCSYRLYRPFNTVRMPASAQYTLHLITSDDLYSQTPYITANPFGQTESLKLTIQFSEGSGNIWDPLDQFAHTTKFELCDKGGIFHKFSGLATRLPLLKYLRIHLENVSIINLTDKIPVNLVELRLLHTGRGTISPLSPTATLSQLKVLGINYMETDLL